MAARASVALPPETSDPRTALGLVAAAVALLLPLAYSTLLYHSFFAPKLALVLLLAGVGLPLLLTAPIPRPSRLAASCFLGWAGLSVIANPQPGLSLWGHANWGTGWLFMAALVGVWAIGAQLDQRSRTGVRRALVAAALVTVAACVLESVADLRDYGLRLFTGRPVGLLGNPVHVGGFLAASLTLVTLGPGPRRLALGATTAGVLGLGLGLSGSRAGAASAVVALGWLVRRWGWRASLLAAGATLIGVSAAGAVSSTGQAVVERLQGDGAVNASARPYSWGEAVAAIAERPALGSGPGRYQEATTVHRTPAHARLAPDTYFEDAHNLPLEYATTIGLPGLALFVVWLLFAGREARGPMLWFGVALVPFSMLQPQTVGLTPLAFLALGAAHAERARVERRRLSRAAVTGSVAGGAVALLAGSVLLAGERAALVANTELREDAGRTAYELLPPWPEAALARGRPAAFRSGPGDPASQVEAIAWYRRAAERNPLDAAGWVRVADFELKTGRSDDAAMHYRRALAADPVSLKARKGLGLVALDQGDLDAAEGHLRGALALRPGDRQTQRVLREIAERRETAGP